MDLTGFRTVITAIVGGPLATLSVKYIGTELDPATQTWLVAGIMTGLMVIMRVFTKTPVGSNVPLPAVAQFPNTTFPTAQAASAAKSTTSNVAKLLVAFIGSVIIAGAVQLMACTTLGITKPLTFNEKLATGYATATTVLNTTDTLLNAGKISSKVATNIEKQDANLKEALDIAAKVNATDATDGGNQLTAALTAVQALSQYLATLTPASK